MYCTDHRSFKYHVQNFVSRVQGPATLFSFITPFRSYGGTCTQGLRYLRICCLFRDGQRDLEGVLRPHVLQA